MFDGKQKECIKELIGEFIESDEFTNLLLENLTFDGQHRYGSYGSTGSTEITVKWKDNTIGTVYVDDCEGH